jgi:hypothetical protein
VGALTQAQLTDLCRQADMAAQNLDEKSVQTLADTHMSDQLARKQMGTPTSQTRDCALELAAERESSISQV